MTPIATLFDERSPASMRERVGRLLSRAQRADFAIARIRIAGIDLAGAELARVRRCRVLVARLDADSLAQPHELARDGRRRTAMKALLSFAMSGRLELRAAGADAWTPDFSVFRGVAGADPPAAVLLVGAHYFARPHPLIGPALTCLLTDANAVELAAARFQRLWRNSYDVLPVVRETLRAAAALA